MADESDSILRNDPAQPVIPQGEELEKLQGVFYKEKQSYKPRPKWQLVYAWILIAILVAGICCSIYWLAIASAA